MEYKSGIASDGWDFESTDGCIMGLAFDSLGDDDTMDALEIADVPSECCCYCQPMVDSWTVVSAL